MIKFKLKVELAKADMTQKALAEKTGIRPSTISDISKGTVKHLPVEALNKILRVRANRRAHSGNLYLRIKLGGRFTICPLFLCQMENVILLPICFLSSSMMRSAIIR